MIRALLLGLIVIGLGGFGLIAWIALPDREQAVAAPAQQATVSVLTAARPLRPGALLKPEDIVARVMNLDALPPGHALDQGDAARTLIGGMVRRNMVPGDVIRLPLDVLRPADHGFLAAVLTAGSRAVTIGVDVISGNGGLIWPGDRVDLILTQTSAEAAQLPGRRISAETVLRDVRVIAIDQQLVQGAGAEGREQTTARTVHARGLAAQRRKRAGRHQAGPALAGRALGRGWAGRRRRTGHHLLRRRVERATDAAGEAGEQHHTRVPGRGGRQGVQVLMAKASFRVTSRLAIGCAAALLATSPALAQPSRSKSSTQATVEGGSLRQQLALEAGSGSVLTLGTATSNVFVADPRVAEVRPASATSLFIFGVNAGRTTVAAMDADGQVVAQYEVTVRPSTFAANEAEASVARLMPGTQVKVTPQAKGLLLTGQVGSAADAARAVSILRGYMAEKEVVENQLSVRSAVQVTLRVRVIEMSRTVTRALGINWQALGSVGKFSTSFLTANPIGLAAASATRTLIGVPDVNAIVDALASDNLARVLAEPNLTVMSGEPASFLAGGEFPIPVARDRDTISLEFKKYGVALRFVPTVLSDGRINLHVNPEVSQLSDQGSIKLGAGNSTISIPGLSVRRAETTVELGSGQSFAIAGLLQDTMTQASNGVPFLGDIPILGALFRSSSFQRQETELVILVTPYVSRPVDDPAALRSPAD